MGPPDEDTRCPTYAVVLADGQVFCELGEACAVWPLRDDVESFLERHAHCLRLGAGGPASS